ncbi:MAG TPA: hypothetical protein VHW01_04475, partial [Polyangiaceae bacterium]|nr:hypothetical protein [Polyangiaceae bacterium]
GQAVLEALATRYPETARIVHSSQLESFDTAQVRELAHAMLAKPASEAELVDAVEGALLQTAGRRSLPASSGR